MNRRSDYNTDFESDGSRSHHNGESMQRRSFLSLCILAPLGLAADQAFGALAAPSGITNRAEPDGRPHQFTFHNRNFLLDGTPFQMRSGQIDPIRIPRAYWRNRIRLARTMGLNTIGSYLVWNTMEPEPGRFDFRTGRNDFAHFIDICAEEGMWVYLRPGPYICGERDFGGLPVWLLRDPKLRIRNINDATYMGAVTRYFDAIAPYLQPRMAAHGGPILMVQIENEYASFGSDLSYLERLRRMWLDRGIEGPFSISDGLPEILKAKTYLPGAALGLDPGYDYATAQDVAGEMPVFEGEGYPGHLSHWGDRNIPVGDFDSQLRSLMGTGRSFNIYEANGGTNFGFGAGANSRNDGSGFKPTITSYDRGAPIDERGVATDEYYRLRAIMATSLGYSPPSVPLPPPVVEFAPVEVKPWASIWDNLPGPMPVRFPQPNELLTGQLHGMVLYRRRIRLDRAATLSITGVHDYATVFAGDTLLGRISRLKESGSQSIASGAFTLRPTGADGEELDILIDSFGHVNYGHYIDRKGLTGGVFLNGEVLSGWQVFPLPLAESYVGGLKVLAGPPSKAGVFFRASVTLDHVGDSYVDMAEWNKGYVWVNGHLLGRYWNIGPQQRLYCPAGWWMRGENEVIIFDQNLVQPRSICGKSTLYY